MSEEKWEECQNDPSYGLLYEVSAIRMDWLNGHLYVKRQDGKWFRTPFNRPLPQIVPINSA